MPTGLYRALLILLTCLAFTLGPGAAALASALTVGEESELSQNEERSGEGREAADAGLPSESCESHDRHASITTPTPAQNAGPQWVAMHPRAAPPPDAWLRPTRC